MSKIAKAAVVCSSVCLAGALIAYEGGMIRINFPARGQTVQQKPAESAPAVIFGSSKSNTFTISVPGTPSSAKSTTAQASVQGGTPGVAPASQPVLIFSTKSAAISAPPASNQSGAAASQPAVILGGSKSLIITPAPATQPPAATSQPATTGASAQPLLIGGSKSKVPAVAPTETPPAQTGGK
jgi:hypothetical protein